MGANWNYALLSKMAKEAGGPELFVKALRKTAEAAGRSQMMPAVAAAAALGTTLGIGIKSLFDYFRDKRKESVEAVDKAEAELIQAIKDYDIQQEKDQTMKGNISIMSSTKLKKVSNPFEDAYPFVVNEEKQKLLSEASVAWDIITENGKKLDEDSLHTVLFSHNLMDIYAKYEAYKKCNEFDMNALQNAIEDWIDE